MVRDRGQNNSNRTGNPPVTAPNNLQPDRTTDLSAQLAPLNKQLDSGAGDWGLSWLALQPHLFGCSDFVLQGAAVELLHTLQLHSPATHAKHAAYRT